MKKGAKLSFLTFTVIFLWFVSVQTAQACSCAVNDTVDKDFVQTPNIAIFKVQSVEKLADGEKGYGYGGIKRSKLTVEKVFKGNLKVGQELIFAQGGGADCIWTFTEKSVGEEYLFYLGDKPIDNKSSEKMMSATTFGTMSSAQNVWVAFTCSRSGSVEYRTGDIKYLENVSKVRGKTRVSGILSQYISAATEGDEGRSNLLSGYKVVVKGNGKNIEPKTDENGFYEIYDLPAGKYTITPEKVAGYKYSASETGTVEVTVKAKSHTEQNFYYQINNRVSGKFFDTNGNPLKDVCLDLLPARGKKAQYFYQGDCTDDDGSFEFDQVPAGTYVIVINEENEITASAPFGTFYYPSALKREDAAEITIGAGDFRDDLIINAPETAETITVSGLLLFENGKPAADESVEFYSEETILKQKDKEYKSEDSRASTDKNGRFTIRILKGKKGKLLGSMITFEGEYQNCPKLDKLIRAKGISVGDIETPSIEVNAVNDLTGIELKFPFPVCKKAKIE
jgi:hypothetical protein